jgi:hypothetical protein
MSSKSWPTTSGRGTGLCGWGWGWGAGWGCGAGWGDGEGDGLGDGDGEGDGDEVCCGVGVLAGAEDAGADAAGADDAGLVARLAFLCSGGIERAEPSMRVSREVWEAASGVAARPGAS